jgi:hypothetical protein
MTGARQALSNRVRNGTALTSPQLTRDFRPSSSAPWSMKLLRSYCLTRDTGSLNTSNFSAARSMAHRYTRARSLSWRLPRTRQLWQGVRLARTQGLRTRSTQSSVGRIQSHPRRWNYEHRQAIRDDGFGRDRIPGDDRGGCSAGRRSAGSDECGARSRSFSGPARVYKSDHNARGRLQQFSNIQGLGQIRFPQGGIAASFEDVRSVLAREGLVD